MTNKKIITTGILTLIYIVSFLAFASAVVVDADYATVYPGQDGKVSIKVDNNENFDIESVSLALDLSNVPFSSIGSSEKTLDDLDEGDDDSATYTLIASTDIVPGDYEIPYILKYVDAVNKSLTYEKEGSFGIRVSAKTDLDFSVEIDGNAIVGEQGSFSVEIINRGLGEIKSVSVQLIPSGYELLSKNKVFIGTINADDSDSASFDVIYKSINPTISAKIDYKDFDNKDQTKTVNLPIKVYTREQALNLGIIKKPSYTFYKIIGLLILIFIGYKIIKRRRRK